MSSKNLSKKRPPQPASDSGDAPDEEELDDDALAALAGDADAIRRLLREKAVAERKRDEAEAKAKRSKRKQKEAEEKLAAAEKHTPTPKLIPDPGGTAGDGFNLQDAMGMQNMNKRFNNLKKLVKGYAVEVLHIKGRLKRDGNDFLKAKQFIVSKIDFLKNYENEWPVYHILHQYFKSNATSMTAAQKFEDELQKADIENGGWAWELPKDISTRPTGKQKRSRKKDAKRSEESEAEGDVDDVEEQASASKLPSPPPAESDNEMADEGADFQPLSPPKLATPPRPKRLAPRRDDFEMTPPDAAKRAYVPMLGK